MVVMIELDMFVLKAAAAEPVLACPEPADVPGR